MNTGLSAINEAVKETGAFIHPLFNELGKVIVGQTYLTERLVIGLLANGHVLLEGVPGLAKTLAVKSLAHCINVKFSRLQFTPDMLPADVIGTQIYNPQSGGFTTRKGPIFANLILADEINRAPAKVQAALLESMQEQQVTIGSSTFPLDKPFLVFATQNPIEQEGTYRLPEAQVDRFMFKLLVGYPNITQEREIIRKTLDTQEIVQALSKEEIFEAQRLVKSVYVDEKIHDYIVNIVFATRMPASFKLDDIQPYIQYGVSPRATLALYQAAKAQAFLRKRHF